LLIGNLHKLWKKFFDATFAFSAGTAAGQFPSSDGWIEDLSDMTQGVGITQRVGDRIAPTSLEFRWLIFTPNAAGLITGLFLEWSYLYGQLMVLLR